MFSHLQGLECSEIAGIARQLHPWICLKDLFRIWIHKFVCQCPIVKWVYYAIRGHGKSFKWFRALRECLNSWSTASFKRYEGSFYYLMSTNCAPISNCQVCRLCHKKEWKTVAKVQSLQNCWNSPSTYSLKKLEWSLPYLCQSSQKYTLCHNKAFWDRNRLEVQKLLEAPNNCTLKDTWTIFSVF